MRAALMKAAATAPMLPTALFAIPPPETVSEPIWKKSIADKTRIVQKHRIQNKGGHLCNIEQF